MSDFTVFDVAYPPEAKQRVIVNTDAKNEADDQYAGQWSWRPAPTFDEQMHYLHTGQYRPIRVYDNVNTRFIHEDFFAKLAQFIRRGSRDLHR